MVWKLRSVDVARIDSLEQEIALRQQETDLARRETALVLREKGLIERELSVRKSQLLLALTQLEKLTIRKRPLIIKVLTLGLLRDRHDEGLRRQVEELRRNDRGHP